MLFVGPHLRVMLATIHVPLMRVGAMLTWARVLESIELSHEACVALGVERPRIAVCGLNPHAGEGGILGWEDERVIAPAVSSAQAAGICATGPLPGDTVFKAACARPFGRGDFDCVVAMYHDQGLIPVKLIDGERAVNVTVGLPAIRTSPAHGTAFDIAGTNSASQVSMGEAIDLAIRMSGNTSLAAGSSR
jgi:4-hydroxythreonine-4-phosphate dehydrogenase